VGGDSLLVICLPVAKTFDFIKEKLSIIKKSTCKQLQPPKKNSENLINKTLKEMSRELLPEFNAKNPFGCLYFQINDEFDESILSGLNYKIIELKQKNESNHGNDSSE